MVPMLDERPFVLDTPDGAKIYGVLTRAEARSGRAVIMAHGFTGTLDGFVHRAARDRFLAAGYDVCRFDFYSWEAGARALRDVTLAVQAADLRQVHAHLRPDYERLYLAGHSYGGTTLLLSGIADAAAFCLWDSLFVPSAIWSEPAPLAAFEPVLGLYLTCDQFRAQVGPAMVEEGRALDRAAMERVAATVTVPTRVIVAADGGFTDVAQDFSGALGGPHDTVVIQGANHVFTSGTCIDGLCDATLDWFARY
jgi:pimeloyl-ACP methyl ester carboxylesterase